MGFKKAWKHKMLGRRGARRRFRFYVLRVKSGAGVAPDSSHKTLNIKRKTQPGVMRSGNTPTPGKNRR